MRTIILYKLSHIHSKASIFINGTRCKKILGKNGEDVFGGYFVEIHSNLRLLNPGSDVQVELDYVISHKKGAWWKKREENGVKGLIFVELWVKLPKSLIG